MTGAAAGGAKLPAHPLTLKISPREINLGDKIVRTFFVISYPRFLSESWFSPIINLDKIFDISIFIHPIDTAEVLRQLRKKVAEVESQIRSREQKGLVRDPVLDTAYQDLESLRDAAPAGAGKTFRRRPLYHRFTGTTRSELDKAESEIKSILESKLVYVKPALFQQEQGFKSVLPLADGPSECPLETKFLAALQYFPFHFFRPDVRQGNSLRHQPAQLQSLVLFDRFSLENYNSVTFAKSGAGKSTPPNWKFSAR